jgi:hypothetical protein
LWSLQDWDDKLRLHPTARTDEELNRIMIILLERDPGKLPDGFAPLYNREDGAGMVADMPEFNERGLMLLMNPHDPPPVQLSSGEDSNEEEGVSQRRPWKGWRSPLLLGGMSCFATFLMTTRPVNPRWRGRRAPLG